MGAARDLDLVVRAVVVGLFGSAKKFQADSDQLLLRVGERGPTNLVETLGVRLTPHKLRHVYGKHGVDRGVDIPVIAEVLGHESLERTRWSAESFALPGSPTTRCESVNRISRLPQGETSRSS